MGTSPFFNVNHDSCFLCVPIGAKATYLSAYWSIYFNNILEGNGVWLSKNESTFSSTLNRDTVFVYSDLLWTAISNQIWLTVSPNVATTGNATLTFTATANPTIATRTATVTVTATGATSQTITVTQSAGDATLSVSSSTSNIAKGAGSTATIDISSNTTWTASSNQPWLTVNPNIATTGNATLTFTATANPTIATRTTTVTVTATGATPQTITVTQSAGDATSVLTNTANIKLTIYPNPVLDKLYISKIEEPINVKIYTDNGIMVGQFNCKTDYIDVSFLKRGLYLINISTLKGACNLKFIKK